MLLNFFLKRRYAKIVNSENSEFYKTKMLIDLIKKISLDNAPFKIKKQFYVRVRSESVGHLMEYLKDAVVLVETDYVNHDRPYSKLIRREVGYDEWMKDTQRYVLKERNSYPKIVAYAMDVYNAILKKDVAYIRYYAVEHRSLFADVNELLMVYIEMRLDIKNGKRSKRSLKS